MKVLNKVNRALNNYNYTAAFTLIEVVIALAILGVMGTVTYSAITQIIRSKNVLDDRRELNAVAYAVLNRMTRELQLAYSGIGLMPRPDDSSDKPLPSNINMIGESKILDQDRHGDSLRFMALEGGQYLPDGGTHSGLVQLMYRVEEDPDYTGSDIETYILVREETPLIRPLEKAFSKVMNFPIVDSLIHLEFRYRDPESGEWQAEWEEDKNLGLPSEVEIRIALRSPRGEIRTFVTSVPIRSINKVKQS